MLHRFKPPKSAKTLTFSKGLGVPRNIEKGIEWLQKAATNGDVEAKNELDSLLRSASGNPTDAEILEKSSIAPNVPDVNYSNAASLRHLATDNRLNSGSILVDHLKRSSGKGELTLDNGLAEDACIKLVQDGRLRASFYVRSGEKFTYSTIPNGTYSVLYCTGYGWNAESRTFTRGRRASRYETPFEYTTRLKSDESGKTILYDAVTLTLHKVPAGNTKTSSVDLAEFDRY